MLTIKNHEVYGWEAAIRGMRNPMDSWDKSDSKWEFVEDPTIINPNDEVKWVLGPNDLALMKKLVNAGSDHSKFMRLINVTMDITAPLYWWKEYDRYKVGTVANSCSTMHKIHAYELSLDDCSCEKLAPRSLVVLETLLLEINFWRNIYINGGTVGITHYEPRDKRAWNQIIQLLPSSYNQRRTVQLNYAVLQNIYRSRRNHKLTEWHTLCDFIKTLPYSELITGE